MTTEELDTSAIRARAEKATDVRDDVIARWRFGCETLDCDTSKKNQLLAAIFKDMGVLIADAADIPALLSRIDFDALRIGELERALKDARHNMHHSRWCSLMGNDDDDRCTCGVIQALSRIDVALSPASPEKEKGGRDG